MSKKLEKPEQSIVFYGKMLTFSRVKLETDDFDIIKKQLSIVSPNKDSLIPIIIESTVPQKLEELIELFWEWGLQPIGVVKGLLDEQAKKLKVALFPADGKRIQRIQATKKQATTENNIATTVDEQPIEKVSKTESTFTLDNDDSQTHDDKNGNETPYLVAEHQSTTELLTTTLLNQSNDRITSLVYDKMLRSGQSVNHVGGDLILTSTVNNGSEAITDNNLHIYGKGLGRLVAGATGDKDAHIFCQIFNPTLVSVAGTYCLRDNIPDEYINKPVHISYVEGEGLVYRIMDN